MKIAALTLVAVMLLTAGVGCVKTETGGNVGPSTEPTSTTTENVVIENKYGDTNGLVLPLVNKPVTIQVTAMSDATNLNNSWLIKELENRTRVRVEIQQIPPSAYADKMKIILASGKLYDIMYSVPKRDINSMGMQGAFVPINKYTEHLPNFRNVYIDNEENSWIMKSYTADDDNLYFWPNYESTRDVNHGFLYRKDIFDKHGIKPWETTEEFYLALKKLKELYPDSVPFSSKTKESFFKDWAYGWGLRYPVCYDEKDKIWHIPAIQPEYKDMITFMKKLYNEGLLDPEFLTDTQASWTAKMTEGNKSFVTYDWINRMDMFYDQVKAELPEYDLRYGNPVGPVGLIRRLNKVGDSGKCFGNNPNKIEAMKLMDYIFSPSGTELITLGVEGITYKKDAEGNIYYHELPGISVATKDLEAKYGMFIMGLYNRVDKRSVYLNYTPSQLEAQAMLPKGKVEQSDPILKFTEDELAVISELEPQLEKASLEFSSKFVIDPGYGEEEWQEWLLKAEKLGAKKLEEAYNSAQKRYDAK